jgi:hypothetical protein
MTASIGSVGALARRRRREPRGSRREPLKFCSVPKFRFETDPGSPALADCCDADFVGIQRQTPVGGAVHHGIGERRLWSSTIRAAESLMGVGSGQPTWRTSCHRPVLELWACARRDASAVNMRRTRGPRSPRCPGARLAAGPHPGALRVRSSTTGAGTSPPARSEDLECQGAFRASVSRCQGRVRAGQARRWWPWPPSP